MYVLLPRKDLLVNITDSDLRQLRERGAFPLTHTLTPLRTPSTAPPPHREHLRSPSPSLHTSYTNSPAQRHTRAGRLADSLNTSRPATGVSGRESPYELLRCRSSPAQPPPVPAASSHWRANRSSVASLHLRRPCAARDAARWRRLPLCRPPPRPASFPSSPNGPAR